MRNTEKSKLTQRTRLHVVRVTKDETWDSFVCTHAGHPLQLSGWAQVKGSVGWKSEQLYIKDRDDNTVGGAQVLFRRLPWPFGRMAYIPRGPVATDEAMAQVLEALRYYLRSKQRLLYILVEPDTEEGIELPRDWQRSRSGVLLPRTLILDLRKTPEALLADIPRKRRYDIRKSTQIHPNIRLATTREEVDKCLRVYQETARRDGFHLHSAAYYHDIFDFLQEHSQLIAVWNESGEPIAFTWLAVTPQIAFELYSGMSREGQEGRANFALKWWCIMHAQSQGVHRYDFNGLLNDGITTFKKNFASHENHMIGSFEYPMSAWYGVWRYALPWARKLYRFVRSLRGGRS